MRVRLLRFRPYTDLGIVSHVENLYPLLAKLCTQVCLDRNPKGDDPPYTVVLLS